MSDVEEPDFDDEDDNETAEADNAEQEVFAEEVTDALRQTWETEEQWTIRKRFLEEHWRSHDSCDRLLALSHCFINMEFYGCRYPEAVEKEVAGLARNIANEYREKRHKILDATFEKGGETMIDTSKSSKADSRGHHKSESDDDPSPSKKVRTSLTPDEIELDRKRELFVKLCANLSAARYGLNAYEKLNFACHESRVSWEVKFETTFGGSTNSRRRPRNESWILIDGDVLIVRACFVGEDREAAKLAVCSRAIEILSRRDFEVRRTTTYGRAPFAYLSSRDRRYGLRTPDEFLFTVFTDALRSIRTKLWQFQRDLRMNKKQSFSTLSSVCSETPFSALDIEQRHVGNWETLVDVFIGEVFVFEEKLDKELSQEAVMRDHVASRVIALLMKDYMRVFDDERTGYVRLAVGDTMLTDEVLGKVKEALPTDNYEGARQEAAQKSKPTTMFALHEQKLAKVRDQLGKVPESKKASERLNIAATRANVPLNLEFSANVGILRIGGIYINRVDASDKQSAREQASALAIQALLHSSLKVDEETPPGGDKKQLCLVSAGSPSVVDVEKEMEADNGEQPPPMNEQESGAMIHSLNVDLKSLRLQLFALPDSINAAQRLALACAKAHVVHDSTFVEIDSGVFECRVVTADIVVGRARAKGKRAAKQAACADACGRLLREHFTLVASPTVANLLELASADEKVLTDEEAVEVLREVGAEGEGGEDEGEG